MSYPQPKLIHWNVEIDGELTEQAMCHKLESLGYTVNRYIYPPGSYFPPHDHSVDKVDGILTGRFKISLLNMSLTLESGDCLEVPKGITHSAEVIGYEPVLSLDAVKIE